MPATAIRRLPLVVVAALVAALVVMTPRPGRATTIGDATRFRTWTGYDVGRFPVAVAAADLDGDGVPDAAWARDDFFDNTLSVQLNLGDGTLGDPARYATTADSTDVAAADLDDDGDTDLVVVAEGSCLCNTTIDIFRNDGRGSFSHETTAGGHAPVHVITPDLDGDGLPDIAVTNDSFSGSRDDVDVMLNQGDGTFGEETGYALADRVNGITAGDFDGDGATDLAVAGSNDDSQDPVVFFLLGDGTGALTRASATVVVPNADRTAPSTTLVAADWNGDGALDLALGGIEDRRVILLNQGGLDFSVNEVAGAFSSFNLAAADYDGDGDADLLNAAGGSSFTGSVEVLPNNGDGTFGRPLAFDASLQPTDVDTADYDRDGRLDIAVANRGSGTGLVLPQRAGGTFAEPPTYRTASAPLEMTTADFDGDGDPDVATSLPGFGAGERGIQTLRNDGSGNLSAGQLVEAAGGSPASVVSTDLDGDGAPDLVWAVDAPPFPFAYALNRGDGTFGEATVHDVETCAIGEVTTADVDGDGNQDVIAGAGGVGCSDTIDRSVSISFGKGDGSFGPDVLVDTGAARPAMALAADVDGDRVTDLVAVSLAQQSDDVAVVPGTGGREFGAPTTYTTGDQHRELAAADLDADGDVDFATADFDENVTVLLNDGAGRLSSVTTYQGEHVFGYFNQFAIAIGDLNVDGAPDLVVPNFTGSDIGVHFGHGDGTFDEHQVRFGMHTAVRDLALVDMNGDGRVDATGPNSLEPGSGLSSPARASGGSRSAGMRMSGSSAESARGAQAAPATAAPSSPRGVSVMINKPTVSPLCTIVGTRGPDLIEGTGGRDIICARGGNDTVLGGGGDDIIIGGGGDDRLDGEDGRDHLIGGPGADALRGGSGGDQLDTTDGARGNDRANGGAGRDLCETDRGDEKRSCP